MIRRTFLGGAAALVASACVDPDPQGAPDRGSSGMPFVVGSRARAHAPDGSWVEIDAAAHLVLRFSGGSPAGEWDREGTVVSAAGGQGSALGELNGPIAPGFAPNGDCWVLDRGNRRLQRFDRDGAVVDVLDVPEATDLAVDADGSLLIAEAALEQVRHLSDQGVELAVFPAGEVPVAVAFGPGGSPLALVRSGAVVGLEPSGPTVVVPSEPGSYGIALAADPRRIAVADAAGFVVRVYGSDGRLLDTLHPRMGDGTIAQPIGVGLAGAAVYVRGTPGPA